jgi:hypothetical protein
MDQARKEDDGARMDAPPVMAQHTEGKTQGLRGETCAGAICGRIEREGLTTVVCIYIERRRHERRLRARRVRRDKARQNEETATD